MASSTQPGGSRAKRDRGKTRSYKEVDVEEEEDVRSASGSDDEEEKEVEDEDDRVRKLPLRDSYNGPPIVLYVSSAPKSKLTKLARQNIVADAAYLKEQRLVQQVDTLNQTVRALKKKKKVRKPKFAKQPCVASLVADHYDVHKSTISRILQTAREEGSVSPRKRSGRPSQLTPTKRRAVVSTFNETKGRASLKRISKRMENSTKWETSYKTLKRTSPSASTISRAFNDGTFIIESAKVRPKLDGVAIAERKIFSKDAQEFNDDVLVCHDEAYFESQMKKGRVLVDVKDIKGKRSEAQVSVTYNSGGKHMPKIFLFGAVVKPREIGMVDGVMQFDPIFDGKVLLARIRGVKKRKRGASSTIPGRPYTEGKAPGDPMYENVTLDGKRYKQIYEMKGGLIQSLNEYFHPEQRPENYKTSKVLCIDLDQESLAGPADALSRVSGPINADSFFCISQEDGAPGHGFNNRQRGKETAIHDALKHNLGVQGIRLVKQSRHSPEFNYMDLGIWYSLKCAVENRAAELPEYDHRNENLIEAKIWQIVQEEWERLEPRKVFNISKQRRVLLQCCEELEGESITKEAHTGIRQQFGTGSPKRSQGVSSPPSASTASL